jgi:hypothetical protein
MNIVVNFEMRNMREDSTADFALIEFFLACFDSTVGWVNLHVLVYVLAITLFVNHVVPIRLESFTADLQNLNIKLSYRVT